MERKEFYGDFKKELENLRGTQMYDMYLSTFNTLWKVLDFLKKIGVYEEFKKSLTNPEFGNVIAFEKLWRKMKNDR